MRRLADRFEFHIHANTWRPVDAPNTHYHRVAANRFNVVTTIALFLPFAERRRKQPTSGACQVLEIGAGIGQMTAEFAQAPGVTGIVEVEPDSRFHDGFIRNNPSIKLIRGVAGDVPSEPGRDGLVAVNVLEHIEDDSGELKNWARLLSKRRGRVGVFVPARPEIYAPIDLDFGHFRRFTKPELRNKMTAAGFEVE